MTRREYEHNARLHERLYGKNWLLRVARHPGSDKGCKRAAAAPQTDESEKRLVGLPNRRERGRALRDSNPRLRVRSPPVYPS